MRAQGGRDRTADEALTNWTWRPTVAQQNLGALSSMLLWGGQTQTPMNLGSATSSHTHSSGDLPPLPFHFAHKGAVNHPLHHRMPTES